MFKRIQNIKHFFFCFYFNFCFCLFLLFMFVFLIKRLRKGLGTVIWFVPYIVRDLQQAIYNI
jgi:hypothetical protein